VLALAQPVVESEADDDPQRDIDAEAEFDVVAHAETDEDIDCVPEVVIDAVLHGEAEIDSVSDALIEADVHPDTLRLAEELDDDEREDIADGDVSEERERVPE
jgi:hypothetical protein